MENTMRSVIRFLSCVLLAAFLPGQSFDELYGQAEVLFSANNVASALPLAESAIAKDGARWEGPYLRAEILLELGRIADAFASAKLAIEKAPDAQKPKVEDLLGRVMVAASAVGGASPSAQQRIVEGEVALKNSLKALAAEKFAAAFDADATQVVFGLRAAVIYLSLDETAEALNLLRSLVKCWDPKVVAQAKVLLDQLHLAALSQIQKYLIEAKVQLEAGNLAVVDTLLDSVDALWPDEKESLYLRAKILVRQKKLPAALEKLQQAVAHGLDQVSLLRTDRDIAALAKDPSAAIWLEHAYGKKFMESMRDIGKTLVTPLVKAAPAKPPLAWNYKWDAEIVQRLPDPKIVTDAAVCAVVEASRLPWKVRDKQSGVVLVLIPAGEFVMGSPSQEVARAVTEVLHPVLIGKAFYAGETEVTQEQWIKVMGVNPSRFTGSGDLPVEGVTWEDCHAFVKKLGNLRLLSEAEWEYSCRAGTMTAFSFGANLNSSQANYNGKQPYLNQPMGLCLDESVVCGSLPANAWGMHEMHGNVFEWCEDLFGDYPATGTEEAVTVGVGRVIRGGTYGHSAAYCRSAIRSADSPISRYSNLGFRVAKSIAR
jgi:formylglycine-generating enzyme required for sulfatase activity